MAEDMAMPHVLPAHGDDAVLDGDGLVVWPNGCQFRIRSSGPRHIEQARTVGNREWNRLRHGPHGHVSDLARIHSDGVLPPQFIRGGGGHGSLLRLAGWKPAIV